MSEKVLCESSTSQCRDFVTLSPGSAVVVNRQAQVNRRQCSYLPCIEAVPGWGGRSPCFELKKYNIERQPVSIGFVAAVGRVGVRSLCLLGKV